MLARLLLIDDDTTLCKVMQLALAKRDFQVEVAYDGRSGLRKLYALKPDAVILDIMLPDMSGWEVCRRAREMADIPLIVLSALGAQENVLEGLQLGADDYVIKPVSTDVLAARIRAQLRRAPPSRAEAAIGFEPTFKYGNLVIDFQKRQVTVDGKQVDLTPTEFRLLSVLARHKGQMVSHKTLLTQVWGEEYIGEVQYVRLYVNYLRRKLQPDPSRPSLIRSKWGVGYQFG
jgi:DNA-binding response OmpR family regulator